VAHITRHSCSRPLHRPQKLGPRTSLVLGVCPRLLVELNASQNHGTGEGRLDVGRIDDGREGPRCRVPVLVDGHG
jgi:hypothetical protein